MRNLITDEMVETAADAQWRYEWPRREFRHVPDDLQDYYRNSARAALETVAPLIAAKALLDAAAMAARNESQRSADWLRARADRIVMGES